MFVVYHLASPVIPYHFWTIRDIIQDIWSQTGTYNNLLQNLKKLESKKQIRIIFQLFNSKARVGNRILPPTIKNTSKFKYFFDFSKKNV